MRFLHFSYEDLTLVKYFPHYCFPYNDKLQEDLKKDEIEADNTEIVRKIAFLKMSTPTPESSSSGNNDSESQKKKFEGHTTNGGGGGDHGGGGGGNNKNKNSYSKDDEGKKKGGGIDRDRKGNDRSQFDNQKDDEPRNSHKDKSTRITLQVDRYSSPIGYWHVYFLA